MQATYLEQRRGWGFHIFSVGQQSLLSKQGCKAQNLGQRECTWGKEQISDTGPSIPWGFPSLVPTFSLLVNAGVMGQTAVLTILLTASLKTTLFCFVLFLWVYHPICEFSLLLDASQRIFPVLVFIRGTRLLSLPLVCPPFTEAHLGTFYSEDYCMSHCFYFNLVLF